MSSGGGQTKIINSSFTVEKVLTGNSFGTHNGYLLVENDDSDFDEYDKELNLLKKYSSSFGYYKGSMSTYIAKTYGKLNYTAGKPGFYSIVVDDDGNMMTEGVPKDSDVFYSNKMGLDKFTSGDDTYFWKYGYEVKNLYTGKTLQNYKISDGGQHSGVAHVEDENGKGYLINSDLDKIYSLPADIKVKTIRTNNNSKYVVYLDNNSNLYIVDKESKEEKVNIKNNSGIRSDFIVNGNYVFFVLFNTKFELHAYNIEKESDKVIFTSDSGIYFNSNDKSGENWFYVEKDGYIDAYKIS